MIEDKILSGLFHDDEYVRKVLPFVKEEYFQDRAQRFIFTTVREYFNKYNKVPSKSAILIEADNNTTLSHDEMSTFKSKVEGYQPSETDDREWLDNATEKFCQDRAVYNAIMKSISIFDGKTQEDKGMIPEMLSDALAVSFDTHVGHDLLEDAESRFAFYHKKEARIPFDLEYFNSITKGGLPNKTLNIILAGTGVGKSLFMCHCAAANLTKNQNVLYITMEMAEEKIAERIDANLLNVTTEDLQTLPKDVYEKKIARLRGTTKGKLIIKEYPTAAAGSAHFRHLLSELKMKRKFEPDIIYVDYLNICASSRLRYGANVNSYTYVKAIAEELRGLAVEFDVPIVSATQTTRSGFGSSDIGLEDTSESFGLPATADFMFALISTDELQEMNQIMVKQLKNRYSDPTRDKRFVIGVDRSKMRLYDVEQHAQEDVMDDKPVFDNSGSGERMGQENRKFNRNTFESFS
jgi:archaellum biogenesis ATPase FlaH